jgi:hypothetical protein
MPSRFVIAKQPDLLSCGPTCLHAVYRHLGLDEPIDEVLASTGRLEDGGTLAVLLGCHALGRGFRAELVSYNLQLFDPTWLAIEDPPALAARLAQQSDVKSDPKLRTASTAYAQFLELGGRLRMEDLSTALLARYLEAGTPLLVGVSATYLYQCARELPDGTADDIAGTPQGHFVVVAEMRDHREVLIADPWPEAPDYDWVPVERLICAILLGVLTYDGNLLAIQR